MKNIQLFMTTLLVSALMLIAAQPAQASYGQYGQVTGEQPGQNIMIDKKVAEPGTAEKNKGGTTAGVYQDNLTNPEDRFAPGERVVFKIVVKNTSRETLKNIVVTDKLPSYIVPQVAPGTYDKNTHTLTYTIPELAPGAENVQYIEAGIYPQGQLPSDRSIIEQINNVDAKAQDAYDADNAKFYIEKEVIGVTTMPNTGPEAGLALLGLQGAGIALGLYLRKRKIS